MATKPPLDRLPTLAAKATAAAEKSAAATAERDATILAAARSGVTYQHLAEAVGVTTWRIGQILKRQRYITDELAGSIDH